LLYVDSTISPAHDFIINLIVFGLMMLNAGLDDQGLISHLSEATAGAWRGVGHSTPYEDAGPYAYMVKYLLSTDSPGTALEPLSVETFVARDAKNDYELPWILRGVMDDPDATVLFQAEIKALKETILSWQPNTRALKDIKKRVSRKFPSRDSDYLIDTVYCISSSQWQVEQRYGSTNRTPGSSGHRRLYQ
jgi:hypothetical protein